MGQLPVGLVVDIGLGQHPLTGTQISKTACYRLVDIC